MIDDDDDGWQLMMMMVLLMLMIGRLLNGWQIFDNCGGDSDGATTAADDNDNSDDDNVDDDNVDDNGDGNVDDNGDDNVDDNVDDNGDGKFCFYMTIDYKIMWLDFQAKINKFY